MYVLVYEYVGAKAVGAREGAQVTQYRANSEERQPLWMINYRLWDSNKGPDTEGYN